MKLNIEGLEKDEAMVEITYKLSLHSLLPLVLALCENKDGSQVYPVNMDLMTKNYSKRTLQELWRGMLMKEAVDAMYMYSLRIGIHGAYDEKSRLRAERITDSIQYIY